MARRPGTAPTRTAPFTVSITAAPDFQVVLTPPTLVLPPGTTGPSSVSVLPINGLGGTFNITVTPPASPINSENILSARLPSSKRAQIQIFQARDQLPPM